MKTIKLNKVVSYLRAGVLLHAVTLIEIVLFIVVFRFFFIYKEGYHVSWLIKLFIIISILSMPIIAQLDARSRFQNYKLVKDHLWQYGFEPRIIKLFIRSRCQRDAVLTAASELGVQEQCKIFFRNQGYKWYHFFPDKLFSKPGFLFTKHFWSQTLFAKTYHSKYNFRKIHLNIQKTKQPSTKMADKAFSKLFTN